MCAYQADQSSAASNPFTHPLEDWLGVAHDGLLDGGPQGRAERESAGEGELERRQHRQAAAARRRHSGADLLGVHGLSGENNLPLHLGLGVDLLHVGPRTLR